MLDAKNKKKKRYILLPYTQCPPDSLKLGTILFDPFDVESTIDGYSILPIPATSPITKSFFSDYKDTSSSGCSGKYGVFTSFLSFLGIGLDLSINHKTGEKSTNIFDKLETTFFVPRDPYAKSIIKDEHVKKSLSEPLSRPNIYMVTGLKIAYGVKGGSRTHSKERGGEVSLEIDATIIGAPVSIGPHVEHWREAAFGSKFGEASDYVYAYRLTEIHYSRLKKKVVLKHYKHGDLHNIGGISAKGSSEQAAAEAVQFEFDVDRVGDEDEWNIDDASEETVLEDADEGNEMCSVIRPPKGLRPGN